MNTWNLFPPDEQDGFSFLLNITLEFNEVYFSEMGEAEATHSRDPRKINLGGETCKVSEPLNSCSILPNTWSG